MKKLINKVKGFTLTELAIVIAVIAILVAVLVPTFISLIDSANETNDVVMVSNLNTILSMNSEDINTPSDALDVVAEEGYTVDKMTPTSDGEIVYNADSKQFIYIYEDGSVYPSSAENVDLTTSSIWYFAKSVSDIKNSTNSYFIAGDWSSSSSQTVQLAKTSVGSKKLTSGSVSKSGNTFIYNGTGNLATTSTLSGVSNIKASYTGSDNATVIYDISVDYFSCSSSVSLTVENYGSSNLTALDGKITFQENSESKNYDTNNLDSTGSIQVCNTEFNSENDVIVYIGDSQSVDIIIVNTTSAKINVVTSYSGVSTTLNEATGEITAKYVYDTENDYYTEFVIGSSDASSTIADAITAVTVGLGTEDYPYTISTLDDLETLRTMIDINSTAGVYYKLLNDIDLGETWVPLGNVDFDVTTAGSATIYSDSSDVFNGIFDGNGYTITIQDSSTMRSGSDYALFSYVGEGATIKNLNVKMEINDDKYYSCGAVASYVAGEGINNITFENITVTGTITATVHGGGVVGWAAQDCTFKNCVNKASITTTGGSLNDARTVAYSCIGGISAMAGTVSNSVISRSVVFENCSNEGALTHSCEDTEDVDYYSIIGNITAQPAINSNDYTNKGSITFTNCSGTGTISGLSLSDGTCYFTTDSSDTTQWLMGKYSGMTYLTVE